MPDECPRDWNAASYHRVSTPHQAWGDAVLARLALRGDETVLDLGCGTGRITRRLLDRLPRGRVIAVDGSPAMVEQARRTLADERVTTLVSDLLALELPAPADAAISTATIHWIHDHDALFARVRAALRPGGQFVVQCGGAGNIASIAAVVRTLVERPPFAAHFGGWREPWNYATPEQTAARLERAGFAVGDCWLEPSPVTMDAPREFLATIVLGAHLERLPPPLRAPFVDAVLAELGPPPLVMDYVRLNWTARAEH